MNQIKKLIDTSYNQHIKIIFTEPMQNPQNISSQTYVPVDTMYDYSSGENINWNMTEYKTPKQYLDPLDQVLQRKYAEQKKGQKDKKYLTRRGFYMDYDLKIAKSIPSSVDHGNNQPWNMEHLQKLAKFRKVDQKLSKHTYLDQIQLDQQKRKVPGVCSYSLQKSLKEKEKDLEKLKSRKKMQEQRRFFHQDIEFLGNVAPGSGNYNPHDEIIKIQKDKNDWKHWTQKHKKFEQLILKRDSIKPNSCSYNPMNVTISTFDRISLSPKGKNKVPGFGTSARFVYQVPEKKKIKQIRPSPAHYKTMLEWKNKSQSPKFKPWNTAIWKGKQFSTISVYE